MTTVSMPNVSINIIPADLTAPNTPQKVLFVGQMLSSGTAAAGELVTDIQNDNSWDTLFGKTSMIAGMIRAARRENGETRFDAIALADNGSAVKATSTVTFTGTATGAGTYTFNVISQKDYSVTVPVVIGDTPTAIAAKLKAALDLKVNMPAVAVAAVGVVTITAENGGTEANSFALSYSGVAEGVVVAITAFSSGATDPSITTVFAPVANIRYQTIISPAAYGATYLTDFLEPRFNVSNNILDGVAIITSIDTLASLKTLGNSQNSNSLVIFGDKTLSSATHKGAASVEAPYIRSSEFGAIRALRLTEDADISRYVVTTSALDSFGGPACASLPYFNTPMPSLVVTDSSLGFNATEQAELISAGVSSMGNNIANNAVIVGEVVTTYKTDSAGNVDGSFKFLNYVDTSVTAREYMFNNARKDWAQSRLTDGDLIPFRAIANRDSIYAKFVGYYTTLSEENYVLTQAGHEALNFYKANLNVTIDMALGKVTVIQKVPLVTQLRSIIGTFQLVFNL